MRKVVLLFLIASSLSADGLYSAGSFGYGWIYDNYKTSITAGYEYRGLYIEAEQSTYVEKGRAHMFKPFEEEYYITAGYSYGHVFIEWQHLCIHGIEGFDSVRPGHDRFTIGFDTRNEKD